MNKQILIIGTVLSTLFIMILSMGCFGKTVKQSVFVYDNTGKQIVELNFDVQKSVEKKLKSEKFHAKQQNKSYTAKQILENLIPNILEEFYNIVNSTAVEPVEAVAKFNPHGSEKFEITPEQHGKTPDMENAEEQLLKCFLTDRRVYIKYLPIMATITEEVVRENTTKVSEFSTYYGDSAPSRKTNVEVAAKRFNGVIVPPHSELSFNEISLLRTEANGYQLANVIENGVYVQGIGGGVCQVSTTLYNAWARAGFKIAESRSHTKPTSYVPLGQDAAVSEWIDMKLENNTNHNVYIQTKANGQYVTFTLYSRPSGYTVKLSETLAKTIPPLEDIVEGDGEDILYSYEGNEGYVFNSYQDFYKNGVLVNRVKIRNSYYAPTAGYKLFGTKEPEDTEEKITLNSSSTLKEFSCFRRIKI